MLAQRAGHVHAAMVLLNPNTAAGALLCIAQCPGVAGKHFCPLLHMPQDTWKKAVQNVDGELECACT